MFDVESAPCDLWWARLIIEIFAGFCGALGSNGLKFFSVSGSGNKTRVHGKEKSTGLTYSIVDHPLSTTKNNCSP